MMTIEYVTNDPFKPLRSTFNANGLYVVFTERVVPYLSRPALPALLLPSGTHLFSPNSICQQS
uniref:Methionine--tRNA ligase N-terminal domain-containing protein n=1 Tax=Oncorhynchus tshawytscha TaxID=74940 RepID=A0AAZ3PJG7_ONCTS